MFRSTNHSSRTLDWRYSPSNTSCSLWWKQNQLLLIVLLTRELTVHTETKTTFDRLSQVVIYSFTVVQVTQPPFVKSVIFYRAWVRNNTNHFRHSNLCSNWSVKWGILKCGWKYSFNDCTQRNLKLRPTGHELLSHSYIHRSLTPLSFICFWY